MITDQIRQLILGASLHHDAEQALATHLKTVLKKQGLVLENNNVQQAVGLVTEYINQVPIVVQQTISIAQHTDALDAVMPLLESCVHYFIEPKDYIPDHHGLFGLFDDAYLTLRLLEKINDLYQQKTGNNLLPIDLAPANNIVRYFLGESLAGQLDAEINQAVVQHAYALKQMELLSRQNFNGRPENKKQRWGNYFEDDVAQFFAEIGQPLNINTAYVGQDGMEQF